MKRTCTMTGVLGLLLGIILMAAPTASVSAQQDSSRISPTVTDSSGYSDSLVRPGYRAMLEDTTGGLGADSTRDSSLIRPFSADTTSQTGAGAVTDTTAMPGRRSEDSTSP
jgi:hypothetical protein